MAARRGAGDGTVALQQVRGDPSRLQDGSISFWAAQRVSLLFGKSANQSTAIPRLSRIGIELISVNFAMIFFVNN